MQARRLRQVLLKALRQVIGAADSLRAGKALMDGSEGAYSRYVTE